MSFSPNRIDGGFGWAICAASFIAHVVALGSQYSIGVYIVAWIDHFSTSRFTASWVSSIATACMLFSGVFVGRFVSAFGCSRAVTIGALLTSAGMFASSFAPEISVIYATFGVLSGVGFSFCFAPSVFIINLYFDKKRALATGIAVAGSGVGTVVLPPVLDALIDSVGWRATLRLHAGASIVLVLGCAAVYARPPPLTHVPTSPTPEAAAQLPEAGVELNGQAAQPSPRRHLSRAGYLVCPVVQEPPVPAIRVDERDPSDQCPVYGVGERPPQPVAAAAPAPHTAPRRRQPICDLTLFRIRRFRLLALSVMISGMGYFTPFVHLVKYAEDQGLDKSDGALAVSVIGLFSTVGRIVFGYVVDQPWASPTVVYTLSMLATGLSTMMLPIYVSMGTIVVFGIVFGTFAGAFIAIMPIMAADTCGRHRLPQAMGFCYTVQTPCVLLGAPLAGEIADSCGSYHLSFILAGLCMFAGTMFLFPLWCDARQPKQRVHRGPPVAAIKDAANRDPGADPGNSKGCSVPAAVSTVALSPKDGRRSADQIADARAESWQEGAKEATPADSAKCNPSPSDGASAEHVQMNL